MSTDERLGELAETGRGLQTSVDNLTRGLRTNRRHTIILAVSVVLDVALTIALATVLSGQADTNQRVRQSLAQNYVTQQQQAQTRTKVLCPLYTILLAYTADTARLAVMTPAQRARVAASVQVVRDGYATLGCLPALAG